MGLFGSSKPKGPSQAFLGADGRPYYEPDPDEVKSRCCCVYVARGLLRTLLALTLVCILGLGAAALIAGPNKYMTYYVNKGAVTDELNFYRIRTGYIRYQTQNSTLSSPTADNLKHDLKDIDHALWIVGIVSAGVTGLSCLAAMWLIVSVVFEQVRRGCVCCYLPMAVIQVGAAVAYYVLAAIYIAKRNGTNLRSLSDTNISVHSVPWPDWAWFFMAGAGLLWLLCAILTVMMPRPTKHVPTQYLQSDAARARGWNLATAAPQDPEAARLPGNMPSSAPVGNDPVLEYHPRGGAKGGKGGGKGWFGRKKGYGDENVYNRSASEIAERYRPRGSSANVELPNAYYNRK